MTVPAPDSETGSATVTVFAPGGIGEVTAGADLAALVVDAVAADPRGPLRSGDIVVVTSKVLSKADGLVRPAAEREQAITEQTAGTVAQRGATRIVRTRSGLTVAAAGVDSSNVAPGTVLLLPADPDARAAALHEELTRRTGCALGVLVSDTAGRAWRLGQTDHAVGAAGLRVLERYAGRRDGYGNELQVTAMAVADEIAGAADLAKAKLAGRPVAVVRGLAHLVGPPGSPDGRAADLIRPVAEDLFARGAREAVLAAVLAATGQADRYETLVGLEGSALVQAVLAEVELGPEAAALVAVVLGHR